MADHKIDGNDGAGNVQAPERIWLTTTESGKVDDWTQWLDDQDQLHPKAPRTEYIRADVAEAELAAILALRDKPAVTVQEAARVLLAVHDGFMDGEPYDKTEADRLFLSASFGAQAFAICPQPEARPSAMLRAFLLALIDPTDPQLDYLRAKNVVRAIAASEA